MASETVVNSFVEANKTYYNKIAHHFDDWPYAIERAHRTAVGIRKAYAFDKNTTTVMEFACGTGLVSIELAPYSKRIVGVDVSQGVVDQFNKRVENQGIPTEEMEGFCAELKGEPGELGDEKFDVIVCASAYHHFTSIGDVTRILTYFLKPGGALLVVDLSKDSKQDHTEGQVHGNVHGHVHGEQEHGREHGHPLIPEEAHDCVPHIHGLGEADMQGAFEGAGLESFHFDNEGVAEHEKDAKLFIVKGTKPVV